VFVMQDVRCIWWHLLSAPTSCRSSFGWQQQVSSCAWFAICCTSPLCYRLLFCAKIL